MERLAFGTLADRLPRIGGMATMPSRLASCRTALTHILAQVERLYLYLDKYEQVPEEFAADPRIVPLLPQKGARSMGCSGKLLGLGQHVEPCLYFCFDDDIIYPAGYVDHLAAALRRHCYRVLVGVHASVYLLPARSYVRDRTVLHFGKALMFDCVVDELGSGTLAFHSSCIDLDPQRWAHTNRTDLMMMIEAVRQEVPRVAIRRSAGFIEPIAENQDDSLYRASLVNDDVETRLLAEAVAYYPGRWCMSD